MDIVVKNNPFCFIKDYRAANYLQPLWQLSLKRCNSSRLPEMVKQVFDANINNVDD